jgi:hypothetical protein
MDMNPIEGENDAGKDPGHEPETMADAGTGSQESEEDAAMPDVPQTGMPTNLPSAEVAQPQDDANSADVRVTSFAMFQDSEDLGSGYYTEFFLTLKNNGALPVCLATVNMTVTDTAGDQVFAGYSYVHGSPYEGSGLPFDCLGAGEEGTAWTNEFLTVPTAPENIKTVSFDVEGNTSDDAPVAHGPTLEGVVAHDRFGLGRASLKGTVRTDELAVRNVEVDFYFRHPDGYVRDRVSAVQLDTIASNSTWDFDTAAAERTTVAEGDDYIAQFDYLYAESTFALMPSDLAETSARVRAFKAARDARRELARSLK